MNYRFFIGFLACLFLLTGCATQQVDFDQGLPDNAQAQHEKLQHFFVFGLVPKQQRELADKFCPNSEIKRVETEMTFLNGLVGAITYNLYTPRTLRVYCSR